MSSTSRRKQARRKSVRPLPQRRGLLAEPLEQRVMLAGDVVAGANNAFLAADVDMDGQVAPRDAVIILNYLSQNGAGAVDLDKIGNYRPDTTGDNVIAPDDFLRTVNALNDPEGENDPVVGFRFEAQDLNGNPLNNNQISAGEDFRLAAFVTDRRGFTATGVFAAFVDVAHSSTSADVFSLVYSETQRLTLGNNTTGGSYDLTLGGETRTVQLGANIGQAVANLTAGVESFSAVGAGNVRVVQNAFIDDQNSANNNPFRFDITFQNDLFETDVVNMTADGANLTVSSGSPTAVVDEIAQGVRTDAEAFRRAFTTGPDYPNGLTAEDGDRDRDSLNQIPDGTLLDPDVFSDVGSFDGSGFPSGTEGNERLLWTVRLNADNAGTISFTANPADTPTVSDVLVFGTEDAVPPSMIDYGATLEVMVVEDVVAVNDTFVGNDAVLEDSNNNSLNVLSNDQLLVGSALTITQTFDFDAGGSATISGGNLLYTPDPDFFGIETFKYEITNGQGSFSTATVTVEIEELNDMPTAGDDQKTTTEDNVLVFPLADLLSNDVVGPDTPLTGPARDEANEVANQMFTSLVFGSGSLGGSIVVDNGGTATLSDDTVTYTPPTGTSGMDTFTYTVTDDGTSQGVADPLGDSATLTITITEVNNQPTAGDDNLNGTEDIPFDIPVATLLSNDSPGSQQEADAGQMITIGNIQSSSGATVVLNGSTISYTPPQDFFGDDTFTYTVTDDGNPQLTSDPATVTITLAPVNDMPDAVDDLNIDVDELSSFVDNPINVLLNDSTGGGSLEAAIDTLTITLVSDPANGSARIVNNGTLIEYEPDATFEDGTDTFTYTITDSGNLMDTATVTINVVPAVRPRARNDSPVADEVTQLNPSVTVDVLTGDLPNVGEQVTLLSFTDGAFGVVTRDDGGTQNDMTDDQLIYTPNDINFYGTDTFTYTINDTGGTGADSTGTVNITINPVNDAPVLVVPGSQSVDEDTPLTISGSSVSDVDDDFAATPIDLQVSITAGNGTVALASTSGLTFNSGGSGQSSLVFTGSINDLNTAIGSLTYMPNLHFDQSDTLSITVDDLGNVGGGSLTDSGTIDITINPINDAPVLTVPGNQDTVRNTNLVFSASGGNAISVADPDAGTGGVSVDLAVGNGTLTLGSTAGLTSSSGNGTTSVTLQGEVSAVNNALNGLTFTPTTDVTGTTSLTVDVTDNGNTGANGVMTDSASVSIEVLNFVATEFSGFVYFDTNRSSTMDSVERGVAGVEVQLTGLDILNNQVSLSTTTDHNGYYSFPGLAPGSYTATSMGVEMTADGGEQVGAQGGTKDDALNTISTTLPFITTAINATGNNFGINGIDPSMLTLAEILASSGKNGVYVATDASSNTLWYTKLDGWEGVTNVTASVASDLSFVDFTITTSSGQQTRRISNTNQYFRFSGISSAGYVLRLDGTPDQLGFTNLTASNDDPAAAKAAEQAAEGEAPQPEGGELSEMEMYAQAVDQALAEGVA